MPTDKMYELAFRFKDVKLWDTLYDDEAFAVRLPDGGTGYCSVMGRQGDHFALGLYVGEEGYHSYRTLLDAGEEEMDELRLRELLTSQNCLQCSFEDRDLLSDEEKAEVRRYAKAHGRTVRGKNAWPRFCKYRPGRLPWSFDSEEEGQWVCEALSAAIALHGMLSDRSKEALGLQSLYEECRQIPLLVREDEGWTVRYTELPSSVPGCPETPFANEVAALRLKRKKKKGFWECGTMRFPEAVQDEDRPEEAPYFPLALLYIEPGTAFFPPILADSEDPAGILTEFAENLMEKKFLPQTIYCADDRCYALLKDLCLKCGIEIERRDEMTELYDAKQFVLEALDGEDETDEEQDVYSEADELFYTLMGMSDDELRQMPKELADMLFSLAEAGELPEELGARIRKLFRRKR